MLTPADVFPLLPALPVPDGLSEIQAYRFLRSISPRDAPLREMENYCDQDWRRFLYTWGLVNGLRGDCLELGSNPYFTTLLLREFTELRMTLANYFGPQFAARTTQNVVWSDPQTDQRHSKDLEFYHFSIESEPFPFPDEAFDVVLFCEIIEHLQVDPVGALRKIKRVLKPGGRLILTTPNVSRLENVARMIAGVNIYDPYSGYGAYGRHNREYNKHELYLMMEYCGFELENMFTADVHANPSGEFCPLDKLVDLLRHREHDLGQYIFARCRNSRPARTKLPSWLYRSYPETELEH